MKKRFCEIQTGDLFVIGTCVGTVRAIGTCALIVDWGNENGGESIQKTTYDIREYYNICCTDKYGVPDHNAPAFKNE